MDTIYQKILNTAENFFAPGERCIYSSIIDKSVEDVMINQYGDGWKEKDFNQTYWKLRESFNKDAYKEDVPYLYMLYYMPINISKIQIVLHELLKKKELKGELKILDVGCAVGTTLFAVLDYLAILDNLCSLMGEEPIFDKVTIELVDDSNDNVEALKQLLSYYSSRISGFMDMSKVNIGEPIVHDINEPLELQDEFDIIIFSNILNEIEYNKRAEIIGEFDHYLKDGGNIAIIEPADERNSKNLGRLKYQLSQELKYIGISPCGIGENCKECWNFRREHSVGRGTFKRIEDSFKLDRDSFYNNRLKWTYCILEKNTHTDESEETLKPNIKEFYVVSNEKNGEIDVCSINTNYRTKLSYNGNEIKRTRFGDIVSFKDYSFKKERGEVWLEGDIQVIDSSSFRNERISYKNVERRPLEFFLKRIWGFDDFKEGQYEIIEKAMNDINTLGILPTGAGKSLCFQLPAMMKLGGSIIVSPLKSLMKDQVDNLNSLGFDFVDYIDSSRSTGEKKEILARFKRGNIKMLYVAPERLQMNEFITELIEMIQEISIDYFIIDEAHCASEWGHDFRPAYLKLVDVVRKLDSPTLIAVTATASPRVRNDILEIFELPEDSVLMTKSLDREEISLSVVNVDLNTGKEEDLSRIINYEIPKILNKKDIQTVHSQGSGIVFTIYADTDKPTTRQFSTTYINKVIRSSGIDSFTYHSNLSDSIRSERQNSYKRDEFPLLIATKGFGMGIDKSNIDYIVHMCYSASLEAYYQEAGRAGRDGEHAHSVIIAKKRHPDCIRNSKSIGDYAPACINRWECKYTNALKCDYGLQARFIDNEYPDKFVMIEKLAKYINSLYEEDKTYFEATYVNESKNEDDVKKKQKYLFYLQKEGLVKDYIITGYRGSTVSIGITLNDRFSDDKREKAIKNIVARLQEFKGQKYAMLASIWEYVDNKTICRRQMLMDYFGETKDYKEGCEFCDIEGISRERAVQYTPNLRNQRIYERLQNILNKKEFDYEEIQLLKKDSYKEKIQESLKIRSMRHLEDYPSNWAALYFSGTITLIRDNQEVYGRNQIYNCVQKLNESGYRKDAQHILLEIVEYAQNAAYDIAVDLNVATDDAEFLEKFVPKIKDENKEKTLLYGYFTDKARKLNRILKRGAK